MDGTLSSPNCDRLLYLEGINRKQTKGWFFFFVGGAVVLVRSSAGFELHTLVQLDLRHQRWTLIAQGLDSESVGDQETEQHGAEKS